MKAISINSRLALRNVPSELSEAVTEEVLKGYNTLTEKNGLGNDFLGWLNLPDDFNEKLLSQITNDVKRIKKKAEIVVVVGIGGSYLGARAVIEALLPNKDSNSSYPEVVFAGHNLNGLYMSKLLKKLNNKEYAVVVISKSGTTTEPSVAFRIIQQHLISKYGKEKASERIIAITDKSKGALKHLADIENYSTYIIPDNVGGRYSVLSPVGLVPIALAGFDISKIILGAKDMADICINTDDVEKNPALKYAATRNILYAAGYEVEILSNYLDHLNFISEWWKQLYGESEGKDEKGIFPTAVSFTTDLHSLGQFIQGGSRILFETVLHVNKVSKDIIIPFEKDDIDGLNYISGKSMHYVNKIAEKATVMSHTEDGIPNIIINIPQINEYYIGQLLYLFEFACGISGYTINVNPFNQPDVEGYKNNMFRLLGKHIN